jgi:lipopolysaccharide export system protein LptA
MRNARLLLVLALSLPGLCRAEKTPDLMMGSVVKSDMWKMDRVRNLETFTGNVSFRNPRYSLKADYAVYDRTKSLWNLRGSVYTLRHFIDLSQVEMNCDHARYFEIAEEAYLERGVLPVRMKYRGADGRELDGRSDHAKAENKIGLMYFTGNVFLETDNLELYSRKGLYDNTQNVFLLYDSTETAPAVFPVERPVSAGKREGYDFAISAERIKFFRDSRDIKFYNRVTGWAKDMPPPADVNAPKKL